MPRVRALGSSSREGTATAHTEDTPMKTDTITLRELTIRYTVKTDVTGQPVVVGRTGRHTC